MNLRLLERLQGNPRLTMSELGRHVAMSSPAVTERVHPMEGSGIIAGYRLDLDPSALGLPVAVFVRVRPDPGQLPTITELARGTAEVVECDRITGEDCFIFKLHLSAIDQLAQILYDSSSTV